MENVNVLNAVVETTGLAICCLALLHICMSPIPEKRTRRYLLLFFVFQILYVAANIAGQIMRGRPGDGWHAALVMSNFCEFFFSSLLLLVTTLFISYQVDPQRQRRWVQPALIGLFCANTLQLLISQFTGLLYVIDENNIYHRGPGFPLFYLFAFASMTIAFWLLVREGNQIPMRQRVAYWVFYILPLIAAIIQYFTYGLYLINYSSCITALIMYILVVTSQTEIYYKQKLDNERLQFEVMTSQIRPHFIFNSLTAIRSLCDLDSEAYQAIDHFAGFLRGSLDLLGERDCIAFERELETVENYLYMEKLRFEEKLTILRDFQDVDFELPACSMQILVENSVRHGIRKTPEGRGTLTMSSFATEKEHVICVEDDGIGFDPSILKKQRDKGPLFIESNSNDSDWKGTNHGTGLRNLQQRLKHMCGGQLHIESIPGKGCRAQIRIPKNGDHQDTPR